MKKCVFFILSLFCFLQMSGQSILKSVIVFSEKPATFGRDTLCLVTVNRATDVTSGNYTEVAEGFIFSDTAALDLKLAGLKKEIAVLENKVLEIQAEKTLLQSTASQIENIKRQFSAEKPKPVEVSKKKEKVENTVRRKKKKDRN